MSTLRISNIEAKSVPASATTDEKIKITNSSGDVLVFIDGKTSGITTVGINTTDGNIKFDANSNVVVTGIITATKFVGTIEPTDLTVSGKVSVGGSVTAATFYGNGANLTGLNSDLVNDTSPQLGGNLDTNSHEISLDTSHAINFGDSNELRVFYHSGNGQIDFNGTTSLQLKTPANKYFQVVNRDNGNNIIQAQAGGVVQLYHNGAKKFDTTTTGVRVHGDEGGTAQLQLLADQGDDNPDYWRFIAETNGILNIQDYGSGSWYNNIRLTGHTGGVMLFQDNDAKFQTQSDGVRVEDGGHLYLHNDSENSSSYIRNTDSSNNSNIAFYTREGGSGDIRWNMTKSGQFIPNANNTYDIGDTSNRVRNIYTMDLHCSNKGSKNDVDGTWGDYTIQEGESDLFLINNRSGKKYKFNLTEVK